MTVLKIADLTIDYGTRGSNHRALDHVGVSIAGGEIVGLVGESGSGKTTMGLAVGRLLPPNASRVSGDLCLDGQSVFELSGSDLRAARRNRLAFVFQNPMAALDPTMRVGEQLRGAIALHGPVEPDLVGDWLRRVGLPDAARVVRAYPHHLSGGMAQRIAIAIALAGSPDVIIADEPTASLDASIRRHILELLFDLARSAGATLMFLSHDLRSVAKYCDRVLVMYAGRIVEDAPADDVFQRSVHPYTRGLLESAAGGEGFGGRLEPIPGLPPILSGSPKECAFAPRCGWAVTTCRTVRPERRVVAGHAVLCHRAEEVSAAGPPTAEPTS